MSLIRYTKHLRKLPLNLNTNLNMGRSASIGEFHPSNKRIELSPKTTKKPPISQSEIP